MANVSEKSPYSGNLDVAPVILCAVNEMLWSLPYCELKSSTSWTSCSMRLVASAAPGALVGHEWTGDSWLDDADGDDNDGDDEAEDVADALDWWCWGSIFYDAMQFLLALEMEYALNAL